MKSYAVVGRVVILDYGASRVHDYVEWKVESAESKLEVKPKTEEKRYRVNQSGGRAEHEAKPIRRL